MPSFIDKIAVVTQAVRTLLAVGATTAVCGFGWYGYQMFDSKGRTERELSAARDELQAKAAQITSLEGIVQEQKDELERLETAMRLLKIDHRVALLTVQDQTTDPDTGQIISSIEFVELDDEGERIDPPRNFQIPGDVVYIDSWVVKFDDKYVEQADLHRSTSLVLFQRIFGNDQRPSDGFSLDEAGTRPGIYAQGSSSSKWEQRIWDDFWSVANDPEKQSSLGIRAAHGEAPSIKVQKGKTYRIVLRASDGLAVEPPIPTPGRPAA